MELTKEQVKDMGVGMVDEVLKASAILSGVVDGDPMIDLDDQNEVLIFRESFKCGYISALVRLGVPKDQVIQIVQLADLEVEKKKDLIEDGADCICGECNKDKNNGN